MKEPDKSEYMEKEEFQLIVSGLKIKLDCGHLATIGHNLANTVIIESDGGGRITTSCHNCGY